MKIPPAFFIEQSFKTFLEKSNQPEQVFDMPVARHLFFGGWLMFFDAMYQNGEFEPEEIETIMLAVREQLENFFTKAQ